MLPLNTLYGCHGTKEVVEGGALFDWKIFLNYRNLFDSRDMFTFIYFITICRTRCRIFVIFIVLFCTSLGLFGVNVINSNTVIRTVFSSIQKGQSLCCINSRSQTTTVFFFAFVFTGKETIFLLLVFFLGLEIAESELIPSGLEIGSWFSTVFVLVESTFFLENP